MDELLTFASNHQLLSMIWVALVIMIIVLSIRIKLSPIKQLSPQELTFMVNKEDAVVVDVRDEKDFKASHIIDAVSLASEKLKQKDFSSLEKYKDKPIIVVCATGLVANKTAHDLHKLGFKASLLKGGMTTWVNASLPVSKK